MNIRLADQQIRFKLWYDELVRLIDGIPLELCLDIPGGSMVCIIEALDDLTEPLIQWQNKTLILQCPSAILRELQKQHPSAKGIKSSIPAGIGKKPLVFKLEVDIRH